MSVQENKGQLTLLSEADPSTPEPQGWRVRVSARVRNMKIQVFPHGGVEVVVPRGTRPRTIQRFVSEHRDWIDKTRNKFQELHGDQEMLPSTVSLAALGLNLRVRYQQDEPARIREMGDSLLVVSPSQQPQEIWKLLQAWVKKRARDHLRREVRLQATEVGVDPKRVQVRLQKSRWGSCSSNGTISLNAALMLRSPAEVRYVIFHELCHMRHMNHSKRYWQLVERFVPDYQVHERALDQAWESSPFWLIGH